MGKLIFASFVWPVQSHSLFLCSFVTLSVISPIYDDTPFYGTLRSLTDASVLNSPDISRMIMDWKHFDSYNQLTYLFTLERIQNKAFSNFQGLRIVKLSFSGMFSGFAALSKL